ncbi:hypothetical protein HY380_00265 [Candidatus Saccharibacteria bacterium]|nr:hypothetical protein [Candidatus Saccharibacteria bacterium]
MDVDPYKKVASATPAPQVIQPQQAALGGALPQAVAAAPPPTSERRRSVDKKSKEKGAKPESTQNNLAIAEIRDGIVIMNDGTFRSVILCKSINFDLMSPQERESVEFAYQGFLNSLYFPIQVFVHSQKVDLRPYLQKLEKVRSGQDNMLLALLMEDYINFLGDIASQANIMSKQFYVVISYPDPGHTVRGSFKQSTGFFTGLMNLFDSDKAPHVVIDEATLENAKTELRNRVQATMQGLLECGVQSLPLDTQELIELYYDIYNPDTATRQQLKDFSDLAAPIIGKGAGQAPLPNIEGNL